MKRKIVLVEWADSWGDSGDSRDILKPGMMTSSGFLLEKNEDYLTIALTIIDDGRYREQLTIPMCLVKKYKVMGTVEVRV